MCVRACVCVCVCVCVCFSAIDLSTALSLEFCRVGLPNERMFQQPKRMLCFGDNREGLVVPPRPEELAGAIGSALLTPCGFFDREFAIEAGSVS